MIEQDIVDYISKAQKHGLSDFEVKQNLVNAGWDAESVEQSFVFSKGADNNPLIAKEGPAHGAKSFQNTVIQNKSATYETAFSAVGQPQILSKPKFYKKPLLWVAVVVLLILAGGAYAYYSYTSVTPTKIWLTYISTKKFTAAQSQYLFSYSGGPLGGPSTSSAFSISGTAGIDSSDPSTPKISGNTLVGIQAGAFGYNLNFKYVLLGKILYVDFSDISGLNSLDGNKNLQWVKFDFNTIQNYLAQKYPSQTSQLENSSALQAKLKQIWTRSSLIQPTNFLARENLNGIPVYHLKNQIDTTVLGQAISDTVDAINSLQTNASTTATSQQKAELQTLISRFKEQQFDVWIGVKDSQLYKIHLVVSAPSAQDVSNGAMTSSLLPPGVQSRDAQRLADIRQFEAALELYHNDFGGYPAAATGSPVELVPYYMSKSLNAPVPADGNCTDYFNGYWYKVSGNARTIKGQVIYPSYTLTFCLGSSIGGYKAGIGELGPSGISSDIACPATEDKCVSSPMQQNQEFTNIINKMDFAGQITIDNTYSNLGKDQNIQAPPNAMDFLDLIKGLLPKPASSSPDSSL